MTTLIRGLHNVREVHRGCTLAIGNFDGLHRGHQAMIQLLQQQAASLQSPTGIMLFEPHPQEFFLGTNAPARLMRLRDKVKLLRELGITWIFCLRFDRCLSEMDANSFVVKVLVHCLGVRFVVCGDDFHFSRARQGDINDLKRLGAHHQFGVCSSPSMLFAGERVGSSRVRQALEQGNFSRAALLLRRPFILSGRVTRGDQRGHTLGFPTANIFLHRLVLPVRGVFIVRVHGLAREPLPAIANCGQRPTFGGGKPLLEVHVLDFFQDIYGRLLEVEFLGKIRDERRFVSLDGLRAQMIQDVEYARQYFRQCNAASVSHESVA